ncbi:alcohol dehydrogenase catalytic domain-containing protein [Actinoplanes sp. NPDC023714]|uniref:zinc-dependent alcohol dehydrogenase n=1 Tax=Actinoplanes sp. NPDC023714 TaxID=3154322 RepID=UPI0033C97D3A
MSATMSAAVLTRAGRIELREVEIPVPGPGELLVRVAASGICGSDLATYRGTHPYKKAPITLGHELAGTVVATGPGVTGLAAGDSVCAAAFSPCDSCAACRRAEPHLCSDRSNLSHDGWQGSFADYVILRQNMTFRLPPGLAAEKGALAEPLSIGLHAVRLAGTPAHPGVAVLGSGSIGMSCLIAARAAGLGPVVCVDRGEPKGRIATRLGAAGYVDAGREDPVSAIAGRLGHAPFVTFVASGHPGVLRDACAVTRPGGTVVVVSYFERPQEIDLNPFVSRELTVRFSALSTPRDFADVIGWLADGTVDPAPLITHRFTLAEADAAMRALDGNGGQVGKVMLRTTTGEQR